MSAAHTPGPWLIGEVDGSWAVYHRVPDPFQKFGTSRVIDAWASSERMAKEALDELRYEARAALARLDTQVKP